MSNRVIHVLKTNRRRQMLAATAVQQHQTLNIILDVKNVAENIKRNTHVPGTND